MGSKNLKQAKYCKTQEKNTPLFLVNWWAHSDSNGGPKDYESSALTN